MNIFLAHGSTPAADVTAFILLRDGHAVSLCPLETAVQRLAEERVDLVLVEAGPVSVAHRVCRQLRAASDLPIILIADATDEAVVIAGYECGADDVIVRPVSPHHLRLRITALARRAG